MTDHDEARERIRAEFWMSGNATPSPRDMFDAGWNAALAYVYEPCGVPTEPGWYLRWFEMNHKWAPVKVRRVGNSIKWKHPQLDALYPVDNTLPHHWCRPRMPLPPEED